jgi:hypothetical protein
MKYSPLDKMLLSLVPKALRDVQDQHREITESSLKKRLEMKDARPDL